MKRRFVGRYETTASSTGIEITSWVLISRARREGHRPTRNVPVLKITEEEKRLDAGRFVNFCRFPRKHKVEIEDQNLEAMECAATQIAWIAEQNARWSHDMRFETDINTSTIPNYTFYHIFSFDCPMVAMKFKLLFS